MKHDSKRKVAGPDTNWFQSRLLERGQSQRALAKVLGLDPAAVSLMLRGKRKLEVSEAVALARLLGVSVEEVLARMGMDLRGIEKGNSEIAGFNYCPHCGGKLK